ncbi:MAG TPA: zinc-dependent alcohol dehydrogenase family protein [Methylomirabilota bacterium]|nr:zinc-dependent alcohol dehydrogenase family protein [Methylomirabilota bacterium]
MKTQCAVLYQLGTPAPYADSRPLAIEDADLAAAGPGEVLVEVKAAGLCHSDLSLIDGTRPRPVPIVVGHEAAGIVREVGSGVTAVKPGDHVVFSYVPICGRCAFCLSGRPALCEPGSRANAQGVLLTGATRFSGKAGQLKHHMGVAGFSRFTVAAQESLIRVPEDFPLDKAALFGCAVLTGVGAVLNTAKVEPGQSVAVLGLGGVGLNAVMGAVVAGASTIVAVDLLASKFELARSLGATHTVAAGEGDPIAAVREITGGGVDVAFECAGATQALSLAFAVTRRGGTTVAVGLPHAERTAAIPHSQLVGEERQLLGSYMGSCIPPRDVLRFMALHRAGRLPVDRLISRSISLGEINQAFDRLARGEAIRQVLAF